MAFDSNTPHAALKSHKGTTLALEIGAHGGIARREQRWACHKEDDGADRHILTDIHVIAEHVVLRSQRELYGNRLHAAQG